MVIALVHGYGMECETQKRYQDSKEAFVFLETLVDFDNHAHLKYLYAIGYGYSYNQELCERGLEILKYVQDKI